MADELAKIDANRVKTALGVGDDANLELILVRVDPVTKRVLEDISIVASTVPVDPGNIAQRDQNHKTVSMGVTDDANLDPSPLIVDNRNNRLFVDTNVE